MTKLTVTFRNFANAPKTSHVLPTQCIYVFGVHLRTEIISPYSINRLVFIAETVCLLCGRTASGIIKVNFCLHDVNNVQTKQDKLRTPPSSVMSALHSCHSL